MTELSPFHRTVLNLVWFIMVPLLAVSLSLVASTDPSSHTLKEDRHIKIRADARVITVFEDPLAEPQFEPVADRSVPMSDPTTSDEAIQRRFEHRRRIAMSVHEFIRDRRYKVLFEIPVSRRSADFAGNLTVKEGDNPFDVAAIFARRKELSNGEGEELGNAIQGVLTRKNIKTSPKRLHQDLYLPVVVIVKAKVDVTNLLSAKLLKHGEMGNVTMSISVFDGDDPQNAAEHVIESFIYSHLFPPPIKSDNWMDNEDVEILTHWPLLEEKLLDKSAIQLAKHLSKKVRTAMAMKNVTISAL